VADFHIEKSLLEKGYTSVAGVDEAGRGALFGPVVAVCLMFSEDIIQGKGEPWVEEIDDSKRISPGKRERLARAILAAARSVGVGMASNKEIDRNNIHQASLAAMKRAVERMPLTADYLLVDGFTIPGLPHTQSGLRHGDRESASIAAASIVAKVLRDHMMGLLDGVYEGYSLSRHKGYGTREHVRAIREKGPTASHRHSFRPMRKREP